MNKNFLKKINRKKAQFFIIDGIFSIIILIMGYLLLFSNYKNNQETLSIDNAADDIYSFFTQIKGEDLCDNSYCSNKKLEDLYLSTTNYKIDNINQTLIEIFSEFYYKYKKNNENKYLKNVTDLILNLTKEYDLTEYKYGYKILIENEQIFSIGEKYNKAKEKINRQTISLGFYENKETGEFFKYGPYLVEIIVWNEK